MIQLKYWGEFTSVDNILYRAEIYIEADEATTAQEVYFAENPIEIEWSEVDKNDPIRSSSCTITLESDTDRRFVDLYSVKPGSVWLHVLRDGNSYWVGSLNPELYEEPYSELQNYDLSITFSDFAILDRIKWSRTGFITPAEVVSLALMHTRLDDYSLIEMVSTKLSSSAQDSIMRDIVFLCDNFWDEDGEVLSVKEVLEEVLRPFGLSIIQKGGKVTLFDLNSFHEQGSTPIVWDGSDAVLSVDKTYNNVEVAFSPYEKTELLNGVIDGDSIDDREPTYSVEVPGEGAAGFNITLSLGAEGSMVATRGKYFKIKSVFSGSDSAGIAFSYKRGDVQLISHPTGTIGSELLRLEDSCYIANLTNEERGKYRIKLSMDLMVDVRNNPFEQDSQHNEEGNWKRFKDWANFAWVPFILTLRDENGKAIAHFNNSKLRNSVHYRTDSTIERWDIGEGSWGCSYMAWYNSNRESDTGLGGWSANKKVIGEFKGKLPSIFDKLGDGYLIDLPNRNDRGMSGWLELKIGTGIELVDYNGWIDSSIWSRIRWVAYKDVKLDLTNAYGKSIDKVDCLNKAWVNVNAKEDLNIDTIIGVSHRPHPTARGQIFDKKYTSVVNQLYRAGRLDRPENLLIGTVYSNYAGRNTILSGVVELLPDFTSYSESNTGGKFLLLSEVQRLDQAESEIKVVQFNKDSYDGIKWTV